MSKKTFMAAIILLTLISTASSLIMVKPAYAQPSIENVSTTAYIAVQPENIVEGQSINVLVQILPAPPSANDVFENLTVVLVSPAQGISGYGPWSKGPASSDALGKATFSFDIPTFSGGWIVELFFPGQYFANNTIYYQRGDWQRTFLVSSAQTPIPSSSPTPSPSPSPPEFTARFVPSSLEVTIKNQPLADYVDTNDSNPSLYYGFRLKDHENIQDWNYAPIYYVGISSYGTYYKASTSDYTVVSFPLGSYPLTGILGSGQVDLQVMALIGNEVPTNYENGTVYGFDGVTSVWSDVQTITIPISSSSPTATFTTLTPSPSIPEFSTWIVVPLVLAATLLIVYKRKGKRP